MKSACLLLSAALYYLQQNGGTPPLAAFSYSVLLGALGQLGGSRDRDAQILLGKPGAWLVVEAR